MSYCTKHPSKEAVGACSNCGHLVCKACYNELDNKVYCTSCANKLFTIKEGAPGPASTPPPAAEPIKPVETVRQPAAAAPQMKDTIIIPPAPVAPEKPAVGATPPVDTIPAADKTAITPPVPVEVKPVSAEIKPAPPEIKAAPAEIKPAPAEVKPAQPAVAGGKGMGFLWWLAPVFLAVIGGLLAWFMNKDREPGKARIWLYTGIGLTVVYAAVIAGIALLSGSSSGQGSIIFARYTDKSWQIWAMDPDGNNATKLTTCDNTSLYFNVYPGWSPATRMLTTYTNRDGNFEIYAIDIAANNQVNLTRHNFMDIFADLSPDGKKIAFTSNRSGNSEIYTMNTDGSDLKQLTVSKPIDDRPRWSPDGKQIAFNTDRDGNHEIYVMNSDGGNQHRLTSNDKWDGMARWSPDGKKITFVSERDGNPEIYIMDADGNNQKRITFNSAKDYAPCFSPDGNKIAFYSNTDGNDEIYIMNIDGGNQVRITNNKDGDQYPLWTSAKIKAPAEPTAPPVRARVVGSNKSTVNKYYAYSDNVTFAKYIAESDSSVDMIRVYSTRAGNVKAAIYDHDNKADLPLNKLSSMDEPVPCQANQWNNVYIPPVTLTKGATYWLAFDADTNSVVMLGTGTAESRMLRGKAVFDGFAYPDKAPAGMSASKYDVSISCWGMGQPESSDETESSPDSE